MVSEKHFLPYQDGKSPCKPRKDLGHNLLHICIGFRKAFFTLSGWQIEVVGSCVYLGVTFTHEWALLNDASR